MGVLLDNPDVLLMGFPQRLKSIHDGLLGSNLVQRMKCKLADEAMKKLGEQRSNEEVRSVVAETPSDFAPILRP